MTWNKNSVISKQAIQEAPYNATETVITCCSGMFDIQFVLTTCRHGANEPRVKLLLFHSKRDFRKVNMP